MSYEVEIGRFVTIPVKRTNEVDLVKPLETFIKNTYDKVGYWIMGNAIYFIASLDV